MRYKKLLKLLVDRDMTRSDLHSMTGVSAATFAKMTKGECIVLSLLGHIRTPLTWDVGNIMEVVPAKQIGKVCAKCFGHWKGCQ